jgi:hypothetical protein
MLRQPAAEPRRDDAWLPTAEWNAELSLPIVSVAQGAT